MKGDPSGENEHGIQDSISEFLVGNPNDRSVHSTNIPGLKKGLANKQSSSKAMLDLSNIEDGEEVKKAKSAKQDEPSESVSDNTA